MAKHFINGGVGLRHVTDTWVIKNHFQDLVQDYVEKILTKLSLNTFNRQIASLCNYWFEDNMPSNKDYIFLLTEYVFTNGAFGNIGQQSANESAIGKKRKVFPNKETMANYYGDVIYKHPSTIPFYWIRLNAERLFKNPSESKNRIKIVSSISETQKEKTKQLFEICELK